MTEPSGEARTLADQWRATRQRLLDVTEQLPESRISRVTERVGWTLRHELASLASVDHEVTHLLAAARDGAVRIDAVALRRLRGEAMHAAQELRLAPLRAHLAEAGERTARIIEDAGDHLPTALTLAEQEATTVVAHLRTQLERMHASVETIGKHLD